MNDSDSSSSQFPDDYYDYTNVQLLTGYDPFDNQIYMLANGRDMRFSLYTFGNYHWVWLRKLWDLEETFYNAPDKRVLQDYHTQLLRFKTVNSGLSATFIRLLVLYRRYIRIQAAGLNDPCSEFNSESTWPFI